jgi:hypothetical protein
MTQLGFLPLLKGRVKWGWYRLVNNAKIRPIQGLVIKTQKQMSLKAENTNTHEIRL